MEYKTIAKNIKESIQIIYKELSSILNLYDVKRIYDKSLPLKPTGKCTKEQINDVVIILEKLYYPYFDALLPMIEKGIVECEPSINKCNDLVMSTLYESWDRLFTFQFIKYNLTLSCIMQIYLFTEQTLIKYLHKYYNFQKDTLQDAIIFLEQNFSFNIEDKDKVSLYKNIINVYKHGYGRSYNTIMNNYPNILNEHNDNKSKNFEFIFNLGKISLEEIYNVFISLLDSLN